jgi:hypothetical protein
MDSAYCWDPSDPGIVAAVDSITTWAYCSGVDKASNTWHFKCARHERQQAYHRLSGPDFDSVCDHSSCWIPVNSIIDTLLADLSGLLPEVPISYPRLPYIFSQYKIHKNKHRWLTNAHNCVFSEAAAVTQFCCKHLLGQAQVLAGSRAAQVLAEHGVDTQFFPIINSVFDATLNMPPTMSSDFTADITRCYEAIPLIGTDSLLEALTWLADMVWEQQVQARGIPVSSLVLWFSWHQGKNCPVGTVRWGEAHRLPRQKKGGPFTRMVFSKERLLQVMRWLICNAFVQLGDRVWRQIIGIAMGLSCSPDWCNIYLLYYEWRFIDRLLRLQQQYLLPLFSRWFRYIDDLRVINNPIILKFLDPQQSRDPNNPFWIYPLHLLEVKSTVQHSVLSTYGQEQVMVGVCTTFLHFECCLQANWWYRAWRAVMNTSGTIKLGHSRSAQCVIFTISPTDPRLWFST